MMPTKWIGLYARNIKQLLLAATLIGSFVHAPMLFAANAVAGKPAKENKEVRTITWEDLVPKDWDPLKDARLQQRGLVPEGSAREVSLMRELREIWDNAPTREEMNGARVRLPGYIVPLDRVDGGIKEFLLVPYFGACIHSPPPPANQIVHVKLTKPQTLRMMEVIWVSGVLTVARGDTSMGVSGYSMAGEKIEPYREKRQQ